MQLKLDHLVWSSPSLELGVEIFTGLTGVTPVYGGQHSEGNTHNALVNLGAGCYLEILAPTDGADEGDEWVAFCRSLQRPVLYKFCLRSEGGLKQVVAVLEQHGVGAEGPGHYARARPDGVLLEWQLVHPQPQRYGSSLPFFIDWLISEHPSDSAPCGAGLKRFCWQHPQARQLRPLLRQLGADIEVVEAAQAGFSADITTPAGGVVTLT